MKSEKTILLTAFAIGSLIILSGFALHSQSITQIIPPAQAKGIFGLEILLGFSLFGFGCAKTLARYKHLEQELTVASEILQSSEQMAGMGSWYMDINADKLIWSDEVYRIFGIDPGGFEATYEAFLHTVHPDDKDLVNDAYDQAIRNNTPYEVVHRIVRPDGEVRVVREKSENLFDRQGNPIHSYGIVQDITEAHRQEMEREQLIEKLQKSLAEIKVLRGILPICLFCKKIREDDGYWAEVEDYINLHSELVLKDSICPACIARHAALPYPETPYSHDN